MHIELAEERVLLIPERFTADQLQDRAWAKRADLFRRGLLHRPKDDDLRLVHHERRLVPFWRIACCAAYAYERVRKYHIRLDPEVWSVHLDGGERHIRDGELVVSGLERCREAPRRVSFHDGLTGKERPELAEYVNFGATEGTEQALAALAAERTVVLPPSGKASAVVREALAQVLRKLDADHILESVVKIETVDLYYRPVHAYRYRWGARDAVVEIDGLTGAARLNGETFEQHVGSRLDARALLDLGAETAEVFLPGLDLSGAVIVRSGEFQADQARAAS